MFSLMFESDLSTCQCIFYYMSINSHNFYSCMHKMKKKRNNNNRIDIKAYRLSL